MRSLATAAIRPVPEAGRAQGRWQLSFRAHVIALVVACVVPLAGLGFYSMLRLAAGERAADEAQLVGTARVISATIDQQFRQYMTIMRVLARRFPRDPARMSDFYDVCAVLGAENGGWILLADADGHQIFNTKLPLGTELPGTIGTTEFAEALATGEPRISGRFTSMIDPQPQFTIYQPIVVDGVKRVLAMTFPTRMLNELLRAQHLPPEWAVSAIDGHGTIVAKPEDDAPLLGQQTSPEVLELLAEHSDGGFLRANHRLGVPVYMGVARSALSGWTVVAGIPTAIVDGPLYQTMWRFGELGGALLLLVLGVAALIGSQLAAAMQRLARAAHALARHEPMPAVRSTVREVNRVASALDHTASELAKSERQLWRSQQHLLRAQQIARMGSIERDLKSDGVECSDETFQIFGVDPASFVPSRANMLALVHPDDREKVREAMSPPLGALKPPPLEHRIIRPDGEIRVLRRDAELIMDETGAPQRLFSTLMDVTELRAAEERQHQLKQKLLYSQLREAARLRESEAQLRRSQQHLALAQRVSRTGSVLYDISRHTEEWSEELYNICGLTRGAQPETFETVLALLPAEDRAKLIAVKAALERGEQPPPMQYRLRRPDGEMRVIQLDVAPLGEDEGPPSQVVIALRDVTELRAAEERLRRSQQHLALAQRVSQTGSVLSDLASGTDEWSEELYHITGLKRGEQPESIESVLALVPEEDRARLIEIKAALQRGEIPPSTQYRIRRPDGEMRVIQADIAPLGGDGGPPAQVVVALRDVTELRAAEEQLRRSQRHLVLAQRISKTGSVLEDIKSGAREWSDELYRILGLEPGATPPTFETFLGFVHEDDRAKLVGAQQALHEGERRPVPEYRIRRGDGAVRVINSEVETILDEAGQPSQMVITFQDMTELRGAEARERDLERQLLHAQKLEALGTLAGGIAHDLNNTLVPVLALGKITMRRLPEGSRERGNLVMILQAGERARDLVRQILAFSRKEAPTRQTVDLAALLRELAENAGFEPASDHPHR